MCKAELRGRLFSVEFVFTFFIISERERVLMAKYQLKKMQTMRKILLHSLDMHLTDSLILSRVKVGTFSQGAGNSPTNPSVSQVLY